MYLYHSSAPSHASGSISPFSSKCAIGCNRKFIIIENNNITRTSLLEAKVIHIFIFSKVITFNYMETRSSIFSSSILCLFIRYNGAIIRRSDSNTIKMLLYKNRTNLFLFLHFQQYQGIYFDKTFIFFFRSNKEYLL